MGETQLTQSEITDRLGISRTTLFRLVQEGLHYTETPSGKKLFDEDEVRMFLANRKAKLNKELVVGRNYSNDEIVKLFRVQNVGGMRRSHSKNALVLFTYDYRLPRSYNDYWKDDILYFTGHGQTGDEPLAKDNKTLAESNKNGITVYLFEKVHSMGYQYRGIVKLVRKPFVAEEYDLDGNKIKLWKFPLKLLSEKDYMDICMIDEQEASLHQQVKDIIFTDQTYENARKIELETAERTVKTKVTQVNPIIALLVHMRAKGICELCGHKAPFEYNGSPYLELHHIVPASEGGMDSLDNIAAVCPNCNARLGKLGNATDKKRLIENIKNNNNDLFESLKKVEREK